MDRQQIGKDAEQRAERYLKQQGLRPVKRNFSSRWGEIDLIMRDGRELVFIEVRQRRHDSFGGAALSVDHRKQLRLIKTASYYLQQHNCTDAPCRFDVIAFEGKAAAGQPVWYKDAFRI
ncbi:YraN family protein [Marinobacterium arenosum]|uniref:YraN family protein n=1 Tax=Marinobacterium arenosum TaxID=2862496 RepID=UPI001C97F912|nr:YraN family protein [Marinobacterium arenosum]MBY4676610.1 YraN family protein [Marinobacterium arenosum]